MTEAIEAARRILAAIKKTEDKYGVTYERLHYEFLGLKEIHEVATELLRLAEPEWGEPKKDGPVWVEGEDGVWACRCNRGQWWVACCVTEDGYKSRQSDSEWKPLNGRRVAPCAGRPRKAGE